MTPEAARPAATNQGGDGHAQPPRATPNHWFPAKTYGWGWGLPLTWQGWVVFVAYVATVSVVSVLCPPPRQAVGFGVGITAATVAMLAVCWLKGEPPRWRWGK